MGISRNTEHYIIDNMGQEVLVKNWAMTSGGGVSLDKFLRMGDFDEALFVGHIDIEYGIRIHEKGYEIHQIKKAMMYQRLGKAEEKRLLWKKVHPYHGALYRYYYQTRNQYYILHKYGIKYKKFTNVYLWRSLIKIVLYEDKKLQRIKMLILGYVDGFRGIMGKCQYHYE